jgi:hypothetical protein
MNLDFWKMPIPYGFSWDSTSNIDIKIDYIGKELRYNEL